MLIIASLYVRGGRGRGVCARMCSSQSANKVRFRARLEYDGQNFHGVQRNIRTQDGTELRTIRSTLEETLVPALGQPLKKLQLAGRTDAGVSAMGQVLTFDAETAQKELLDTEAQCSDVLLSVNGQPLPVSALAEAINACLPSDLRVKSVDVVPRSFDVVRDCKWKTYRYSLPPCHPDEADDDAMRVLKMVASHADRAERNRLVQDGGVTPPKRRRRGRSRPALAITDVDAMSRAAALLEGTHDFAAFRASGGDQKGTVRTIFRCTIEPRQGTERGEYDIVISGDGFLYRMVRIIAGSLVTVGMELAPPDTVSIALAAELGPDATPKSELRRRGVVGPTLPPEQLCLEHVEYDTEFHVDTPVDGTRRP